ncbi:MAG: hypothetical protein K2G28_04545 [Acetatifactor sp.]|nr:hypothetical protein [Acetatifactor sp.]
MKLQYYLRGLGIGIIVTALVMGITKDRNEPLTDAEIRAMALEIGMVDSNSLKLTDTQASGGPGTASGTSEPDTGADLGSKEDESESEEPSEDDKQSEEGEDGQESGGSSEGEKQPEEGEDGRESGGSSEGEKQPEEGITVEIEPGAGSRAVCRMLEAAGLVEDADSFDQYLIDNGYSKRIRMGTYVIMPGTDPEEIARIITRDR